jgi:Fe-S-cluster containining protein
MTTETSPGKTALDATSLCLECGLCCDGSLHSTITVTDDEIDRIAKSGIPLRKTTNGKVFFVPPCPAFKNTSCSIHDIKPKVCRDFQCTLHRKVMNGSQTLDEAIKITSAIKMSARNLVQQVEVPENRKAADLNLRNYLFAWLDETGKVRMEKGLSPQERHFLFETFAYAKLIDQHFHNTPLLTKCADLIMELTAREKTLKSMA